MGISLNLKGVIQRVRNTWWYWEMHVLFPYYHFEYTLFYCTFLLFVLQIFLPPEHCFSKPLSIATAECCISRYLLDTVSMTALNTDFMSRNEVFSLAVLSAGQ
jgi:hypothetical protein